MVKHQWIKQNESLEAITKRLSRVERQKKPTGYKEGKV